MVSTARGESLGHLAVLLILLQFVLPFFAMLSERLRYGPSIMLALNVPTLALMIGWLWFKSFALMAWRPLGPAVTLAP